MARMVTVAEGGRATPQRTKYSYELEKSTAGDEEDAGGAEDDWGR